MLRGSGRALLSVVCVLAVAATGCGSSGDDSRDEALESLRLTTEAAGLQSEMGKLVGSLGGDPSPAQRVAVRRRLASLDREAADLIAAAGADSTYEVDLRPLNGARAAGTATLVESDGRVAMRGTFGGLAAGGEHPVTIHALAPGQGRSVCPPRNAAAGSDHVLSAAEGEDFYGRPAVNLGSIPGGGSRRSLSFTQPAAGSPPLDVRVLVLSGGLSEGAYRADLPVSCGVPTLAESPAPSSSTELVAAVNQTRAAGIEIASVVRDPTSPAAAVARHGAATHLDSAAGHLGVANHIAVQELREAGEVSAEDRQAAARAAAAVGGSRAVVRGGFAKLGEDVASERREERRRLVQRRGAQEAARGASEEAAPAPASEPSPQPEYTPEPESVPEPAPTPTPSAPAGPTVVSP